MKKKRAQSCGLFFPQLPISSTSPLSRLFSLSSSTSEGVFFSPLFSFRSPSVSASRRGGERDVRPRERPKRETKTPRNSLSFFPHTSPQLTRKREQSNNTNTNTNAAFDDSRVFLDEEAIRRARDLFVFLVFRFLAVSYTHLTLPTILRV